MQLNNPTNKHTNTNTITENTSLIPTSNTIKESKSTNKTIPTNTTENKTPNITTNHKSIKPNNSKQHHINK